MSALVTGLPGAGKTLFAIQHVRAVAAAAPTRPVYYSGITDLKLPWIELEDATQWYTLPVGSIVLIDEAQRFFRPRASTAQVPKHVSEVETHRHKGFDLFLVTQHPTLVDANIRRLLDRHYHLVRKFGMEWATVHEFFEVREHPDRYRVGSMESQFKFSQAGYALYKSAELHTRKRRIPWQAKLLLLAPVVVLAIVYVIYREISSRTSGEYLANLKADSKTQQGLKSDKVKGSGPGQNLTTVVKGSSQALSDYLVAYTALIPGLAYTAPIYEKITTPVAAPAPVACVQGKVRCVCYSEQGTKLADVPLEMCKSIVADGFFVAWQARAVAAAPVAGAGGAAEREPPPAPNIRAVAMGSRPGSQFQAPPAPPAPPPSDEDYGRRIARPAPITRP